MRLSYLLAVITGNKWFWAVGSACWAFWLAPFTPFIPLCIAITFAGRKIYDKIKKERRVMPKQKRLTDKEKAEVITDYASGKSQQEIAEKFTISKTAVLPKNSIIARLQIISLHLKRNST